MAVLLQQPDCATERWADYTSWSVDGGRRRKVFVKWSVKLKYLLIHLKDIQTDKQFDFLTRFKKAALPKIEKSNCVKWAFNTHTTWYEYTPLHPQVKL